MSAYKTIQCSFKDPKTLVDSLKDLGLSPVIYDEKHNLRGYTGDIREEKAEIIVPKEQLNRLFTGASNDLGFSFDSEKKQYNMLCSDYDMTAGVADKVTQSYALTAIKTALNKNKFNIVSEKREKTIVLNATKII